MPVDNPPWTWRACAPRRDVPASLLTPTSAPLQIPTVATHAITLESFLTDFVRTNTPVLIKGGVNRFLHEPELWTASGMNASAHSHVHTELVDVSIGRPFGGNSASMTIAQLLNSPTSQPLTYSSRTRFTGPTLMTPRMQAGAGGTQGLQSEFWKRLATGRFLDGTKGGIFSFKVSRRSGALPHSHIDTLNLLTEGAKRWMIVRVDDFDSASAKRHTERHVLQRILQRSPSAAALSVEPLQRDFTSRDYFERDMPPEGRYYDFLQHAGDVLYVPDVATHATLDVCDVQAGAVLQGAWVVAGVPSYFAGTSRAGEKYLLTSSRTRNCSMATDPMRGYLECTEQHFRAKSSKQGRRARRHASL